MSAEIATGSIFAGDYRVLRAIGSGGMGTVYEVEQLSTRKHRALKLLQSRLGHDDKAHSRFVREATVGAHVESEHVVEVIAAGIDPPSATPWLAMELLDGADLKRVVQGGGGLDPAQALSVFRQIGHGLAAAHRAGVIHRDLKPENIFVARSRRAGSKFTIKLLDFGIAKLTHELTASTDTGTVGSPLWMAPEQLNALPVSARTDVWALGLLAFWALCGKVYWKTAHQPRVTVQALFAEQLFSELEPPSARAEKLGITGRIVEGFDGWFAACVHRDPQARFETAAPAIAALESILEPAAAEHLPAKALLPPAGQPVPVPPTQSGPIASGAAGYTGMDGTTGAAGILGPDETFAATTLRDGPPQFSEPPTNPEVQAPPVAPTPPPLRPANERPKPDRGFGAGHVAVAVAVPAMVAGAIAMWVISSRVDTPTPRELRASVSRSDVEAPSDEAEPDVTLNGSEEIADSPTRVDVPPADPPRQVGAQELDGPSLGLPDGNGPNHRFMGWTVDGELFALRTAFGVDKRLLEVVQVHDGVTGARLERYVVEPANARGQSWPPHLSDIVAESGDSNDWTRRRVDLLLRRPDPRRAPEQGWELRLSHRPVPEETTVQVLPKRRGFEFRWYGFKRDARTDSALLLWLDHVSPRRRDRLLKFIVPLTYAEAVDASIAGRELPAITGTVLSHWSPDRTRCIVTVSTEFERGLEAQRAEHWFMRAAGPQIELVDAGAGRQLVREAAVKLSEASLTTARFSPASGRPPVTSEVQYATGEEGLAEQIRQALEQPVTLREEAAMDGLAARIVLAKED